MSAIIITILIIFYTKPIASACTSRCGSTWSDANTKCGSCCTNDIPCGNDTCWADLDTTPCITPSPTICNTRCGLTWDDSNTNCGTCCTVDDDCASNNACFADVDTSPCIIPTTAIPTNSPIIGNTIGNYRVATVSSCGSGKYVSLTFDDGPQEQNEATAKIINTLNTYGIKATFYVSPAANGDDALGLARRCILIKNLTESGNEIQSHSWSHPDFAVTQLTQPQMKIELDTVRDYIINCGGIAPTIFRPPYGSLDRQQAEYIVQNLTYIIGLWNLDSNDWRTPNNFSGISPNFNLNLFNGDSINVLMHDSSVYNVLDDIINLFNNGYEFITQSECFRRCDTIDHDGICNDLHGQDLTWVLDSWRSPPTTSAPTSTTNYPTLIPTNIPSQSPSKYPTINPSIEPTIQHTKYPSIFPSKSPSKIPTEMPTNPTQNPTENPTENPTQNPSQNPTQNPSEIPTQNPTEYISTMIEETDSGGNDNDHSFTLENVMNLMKTEQGILYAFLGVIAIALWMCCCIGICCFCKRRKRELEKNISYSVSPHSIFTDSNSTTVNINPMRITSFSQKTVSV